MSFQLSIPWRVALQQSSPPLSQLLIILQPTTTFIYTMTANGSLGLLPLSQLKGALQGQGEGDWKLPKMPNIAGNEKQRFGGD